MDKPADKYKQGYQHGYFQAVEDMARGGRMEKMHNFSIGELLRWRKDERGDPSYPPQYFKVEKLIKKGDVNEYLARRI